MMFGGDQRMVEWKDIAIDVFVIFLNIIRLPQ